MRLKNIIFNQNTLSRLPIPPEGVQREEYSDVSIPQLRVYRYKRKMTWVFKTCHQYKEIRETLGHYPYVNVSEAKSMVLERLQQLEHNNYVFKRGITVRELFESVYMVDLRLNKRNTQSELSKCQNYLLAQFGNRKVLSISSQELSAYFLSLRGRLSVATVNRVIAIFKRLFRLAVEHGYCIYSPMQSISMVKENNSRYKVMNRNECTQFLTHCIKIGSKGSIALYLSLSTGMRISEVISLKISDVNLIHREIKVSNTKNGSTYIIPLMDEVTQVLSRYMPQQGKSEYLFPSNLSKSGYIASPKQVFHHIMSLIGLSGYYIHDLRRSYATLLLQETKDIQLVSQMLNHRSIVTTQRYARFDATTLKQRMNTVNLFNQGGIQNERLLN